MIVTLGYSSNKKQFKDWWKKIEGIDLSEQSGYGVKGEFLKHGSHDLRENTLLLHSYEQGSWRNHRLYTELFVVKNNTLEEIASTEGWDWFVKLKYKIAEMLKIQTSELSSFTDKELIAELQKRGYKIEKQE